VPLGVDAVDGVLEAPTTTVGDVAPVAELEIAVTGAAAAAATLTAAGCVESRPAR
jgi:hypothetical protein